MHDAKFRVRRCSHPECRGIHCACGSCMMPNLAANAYWCKNLRCGNVVQSKEFLEAAA